MKGHDTSIALLGANLSFGQPKGGTQDAYSWLKTQGIATYLQNQFFQVFDAGAIEESTYPADDLFFKNNFLFDKAHHFASISAFNKRLANQVSRLNQRFDLTLNIGGDHSSAMGSVGGSLINNPETKVIWVDAHADFNSPKTSPSGNVHGMPLSFLTGYFKHPTTDGYLWWMPKLNPKNIAMIGLRDLDPKEPQILEELGILYFTTEDVQTQGIGPIMNQILETLDPEENSPFHLSFDVDGIDCSYIPSTGTAVENGLSLSQGTHIIQQLFKTGRLKTFDLAEINPSIGSHQDLIKTKEAVFQLLEALKSKQDLQPETLLKRSPQLLDSQTQQ